MKGTEMNFEKLQKEIFEILQEGLSEYEDKRYTTIECDDMAKDIADLVMRRMDIPDTHVMKMADQAMEIDRLKARIAELEEKLRWIPVEERFPEVEKTYLVKGHLPTYKNSEIWECRFLYGQFQTAHIITHWMEVPEL